MINAAYPYRIADDGTTAVSTYERHVREMIEQLLFTNPGERVHRPTFGCGLLGLLFEPNSDLLAATTQALVAGSLQQWLGTVIDTHDVTVESEDSTIRVTVTYSIRRTGDTMTEVFARTK